MPTPRTSGAEAPGLSAPERDAAAVAATDKRVSTARAKLAMRGFQCHVVTGGFMACRWGQVRELETLDELERFVEHVCGGQA